MGHENVAVWIKVFVTIDQLRYAVGYVSVSVRAHIDAIGIVRPENHVE